MTLVGNVGTVKDIFDMTWTILGVFLTVLNIACLYWIISFWTKGRVKQPTRQAQILSLMLALFWFLEVPILVFWYVQSASKIGF